MLFVSFNDSSDPTYASAAQAELVSNEKLTDDNPCSVEQEHAVRAPLVPRNRAELVAFAQVMGWDVVVDDDEILIRTNIRC